MKEQPSEALPTSPSRVAASHEIDSTEDLTELFTKAAGVLVGEVSDVSSGRVWAAESDAPLTDRLVSLKVTGVLKGDLAVGSAVRVVEGYWNENGDGVELNSMTWSRPGDSGIYFLKPRDIAGEFRFVNSYGRLSFGSLGHVAGPSGGKPYQSVWAGASPRLTDPEDAIAFVRKAAAARVIDNKY